MQSINTLNLTPLTNFLPCPTPKSWLSGALKQIPLLLIDHAHCEKKAASTALSLIYRYPEKEQLLIKLSKLVREEMLHFEKVIKLLKKRGISFTHLSPSRYASQLHHLIDNNEPQRLVDTLIVGAIIEARSCERFAALAPFLDKELKEFYLSLLKSEARHFEDYLSLAKKYSKHDNFNQRISYFLEKEKTLIESPDKCFRFHSGSI